MNPPFGNISFRFPNVVALVLSNNVIKPTAPTVCSSDTATILFSSSDKYEL